MRPGKYEVQAFKHVKCREGARPYRHHQVAQMTHAPESNVGIQVSVKVCTKKKLEGTQPDAVPRMNQYMMVLDFSRHQGRERGTNVR